MEAFTAGGMHGQNGREEIADTKRRITDVEGVLMEQFDDRSEVGSIVSSVSLRDMYEGSKK